MSEIYKLHNGKSAGEASPLYAHVTEAVPGLSRRKARQAITAGLVQVAGRVALDPQKVIESGQKLRIDLRQGIPSEGAQKARGGQKGTRQEAIRGSRAFTVLHQDNDVMVVDKAAGLLAAPSEKGEKGHVLELVRHAARKQGKELPYLGQIHRIDQPTSGCLVIALNKQAQSILSTQFATHCAEREYRCLVLGGPKKDKDRLDGKLGRGNDGRRAVVTGGRPGKEAVTHFEVIKRYEEYADIKCRLETGRTHQIRVHLSSIGCPILGDHIYMKRNSGGPKVPRLMLHAQYVRFDHPTTGARIEIEAPLPDVYTSFID